MAFSSLLDKFVSKERLRGTQFLLMFTVGQYRKIPNRQINQSAFKYAGPDRAISNGHIINLNIAFECNDLVIE